MQPSFTSAWGFRSCPFTLQAAIHYLLHTRPSTVSAVQSTCTKLSKLILSSRPPPMSSAYLPTEIWFQILNFATLTPTERRTLRLTNRIFNRFLTPLAFETIRLTSFTKHAFDGILHLAQNTELAAYVKVFEYQVEEFIEARK